MIFNNLHGLAESEDWGDICDTYKRLPAGVVLVKEPEDEQLGKVERQ